MKIRTLHDVMTPVHPEDIREWEVLRKELAETLRFSSSVDLLRHDAPLDAKFYPALETDGIVIEKVVFQTLPGFYVAGNLYRPADTTKKYPAILNPHGHWDLGRTDTDPLAMIPTRCANFAMRGMVAFIYDMVGFCDTCQISHDGFDPEYELYNFGRFSIQLNNSIKALDLITSLPYVDAERIGCTGCSGGGTQTYFLTAADPRVKAAAPINMSSVTMQGGCRCENTAFLRNRFCNVDYTMLAAPRPLFMAACDGDWTRRSRSVEFPAIRRIYEMYGAEDRFETFYRSAPHCYEKVTREKAYDFFSRVLQAPNPFEGEALPDIDTDALLFGTLPLGENAVKDEKELFAVAKEIIKANLAGLGEAEREELRRRVFALDEECPLDIPYIVRDADGTDEFVFGTCPAPTDDCGALYFHTYNLADDTKRVNALFRLMRLNPGARFIAGGKTAALCEIAAKLAGCGFPEPEDIDRTDVFIPGYCLTGLTEG